jgi:hypothetical protein
MHSGQPEYCQLCVQENIDNRVPLGRRKTEELPCSKHGDPRWLYPANVKAVEFYGWLPAQTVVDGDKQRVVRILDIPTINILCEWYGVQDRKGLFEQLKTIHGELNEINIGSSSDAT